MVIRIGRNSTIVAMTATMIVTTVAVMKAAIWDTIAKNR
jgi:hypothetical protein